jgi:hypothetical protein
MAARAAQKIPRTSRDEDPRVNVVTASPVPSLYGNQPRANAPRWVTTLQRHHQYGEASRGDPFGSFYYEKSRSLAAGTG